MLKFKNISEELILNNNNVLLKYSEEIKTKFNIIIKIDDKTQDNYIINVIKNMLKTLDYKLVSFTNTKTFYSIKN